MPRSKKNKKFCKNVLVNIDDEYGKLFLKLTNSNCYSYGLNNPNDCFAMDVKLDISNTKFLANIFDNVFISLICKQKKHPRIFKFLELFSFYSKISNLYFGLYYLAISILANVVYKNSTAQETH